MTQHDNYFGGVAQWLGRRSLADGLSLIYNNNNNKTTIYKAQ